MNIQETKDAARGKWRGILISIGVGEAHLHKKHGPCPLCGGKDRFTFDNKHGEGTYYCQNCGAGDGFTLAQKATGKTFIETVKEISDILGVNEFNTDPAQKERTDEDYRAANRKLWISTQKMIKGNTADMYLQGRRVGQEAYVDDLRYGDAIRDGEGGSRPCFVALVRGPDNAPNSMHRTFLAKGGNGKAEMASPRKMMAGPVAVGSCIRLMDWDGVGPMGIAEGIETAFAAADRFKIPVWSAVNASMMARWIWPDTLKTLFVFGDNDSSFTGQAAAFELARRFVNAPMADKSKRECYVHIPSELNTDWADMVAL